MAGKLAKGETKGTAGLEGRLEREERSGKRGERGGSLVFPHPIDLHLVLAQRGRKAGRRKRGEEERVVEGWPHDISRLYARPTPNFAELPYDSLYPILRARLSLSSYDSTL